MWYFKDEIEDAFRLTFGGTFGLDDFLHNLYSVRHRSKKILKSHKHLLPAPFDYICAWCGELVKKDDK